MSAAPTERSIGNLLLRAMLPMGILAGGILTFLAISQWLVPDAPREESSRAVPTALAAIVESHPQGFVIEADGVVVPYREITMSAEVSGTIVQRSEACRAGNYVHAGQPLLTIDPQDYQLEVDRLEKEYCQATIALEELHEQVRGAESLIEIARKDLELRSREVDRLQKLGRTAISVSDLEKVETAELAARNALVTLDNRVALLNIGETRLESARDLASLQLEKAQIDLRRTAIVAPTNGVIVTDFVEENSFVQRGTPLVTIEDTSKAEVKCKLRMEDLYWLWDQVHGSTGSTDPAGPAKMPSQQSAELAYDIPDIPVEVQYCLTGASQRTYTWQGQLTRYDGIGLDEKTRTVPCRVVVDQPRQRVPADQSGPPALLRGMYVTIRVIVVPQTPLLRVPEVAIRPGNFIWCVRQGTLTIIPIHFVTLLETDRGTKADDRQALVSAVDVIPGVSGQALRAGDQVVVSPLLFVRTGMEIQVTEVVTRSAP